MTNQKIPLLIGLTIIIVLALIIWVAGTSSGKLPDRANQKSVIETTIEDDKTEAATASQKLDAPQNTEQPESAKTLRSLIDDAKEKGVETAKGNREEKESDEQLSVTEKSDQLDKKITKLDETLQNLDRQLEAKGIKVTPDQTIDEDNSESASQLERLQTIKDRLENN